MAESVGGVREDNAMAMLPGFGVQGFRSVGAEMQFLAPLDKVSLVAGQNNVGKSNIIRIIRLHRVGDGNPASAVSVRYRPVTTRRPAAVSASGCKP
jgi:hypothetical protein